nr:uncharacterized protein LOC111515789 [Leptinotarsa decemlineata]
MLIFKLLVIWAIWFRSSHSVTPGVLLALAHLQNQKARNIANALNWRAKAQYSVALAKARANLAKVGDRRIIRNSREFNIDDVLGNGPETNPLLNNDNFEGVSQMKLSSNENNEFHADQWVGIPGYQIENEGAEAVTDKDIEVYDTPDLPHQISNVPNCDMPSYQCNGFETDFYPGTEG